jgi:hypothetical protein
MPRDHAEHIGRLLNALRHEVDSDKNIEPIEVTSAALLLAMSAARHHSHRPPDLVRDLLEEIMAIQCRNKVG